jgi:hypothetical protein
MARESTRSAAVLDEPVTDNTAAITPYWQIGLTNFNSGQPSTTAMQQIWQAMFPASLPLLAQIVGALYAEHYFDDTGTQMSVNLLANELSAALGKNLPDCQRAAATAFSQWYGLQVRASVADVALIPRADPVFESPDVVVNGLTTLTPQQLITMWNQTVWGPISGDKNIVYGRAASVNIGVPITQPVMKMYIVEAALNPPAPNSWTQLFTQSGSPTSPLVNNQNSSTLQRGDRAASSDAFVWTVPGTGHYCVISVAGTEFFTNDPSLVPPGNWASGTWIHYNGAAGWHNLGTPLGDRASLKIHNLDGTTERFEIEAVCDGLPAGTEVFLESADPKLAAPIRSGVTRIGTKEQIVSADAVLPGNYSGNLTVGFKTPDGKPLSPSASIEVRMYWSLPPGHRHYEDAVKRLGDTTAMALHRPVRQHAGSFRFVGRA